MRDSTDRGAKGSSLASLLPLRLLWDNVRIHLDRVEGRGSFLELEAVVDAAHDEKRCAEQRSAVAAAAGPILAKAAAADRVLTAVRTHPITLTLAASAVTGLLPRLLPRWVTRVLLVVSVVKALIRPAERT